MPRSDIIIKQRRALRRWRSSQTPTVSQKAYIDWFHTQLNHRISQSTVYGSLPAHFLYIDDLSISVAEDQSRLRTGHQDEPEQLLAQWQLSIEARRGLTFGDIKRPNAQVFWIQLM